MDGTNEMLNSSLAKARSFPLVLFRKPWAQSSSHRSPADALLTSKQPVPVASSTGSMHHCGCCRNKGTWCSKGRPKQKLRKIMEVLGSPVWQHWWCLLYHIQSQEVNIIPEYSTVSPGSLWGSSGQENRNEDDAQTGGDRTAMVMWEAFGVLLLSATGISRRPGFRTARLTGTKDSLKGLLLILSTWGFFLFVLGFGGDSGGGGFLC